MQSYITIFTSTWKTKRTRNPYIIISIVVKHLANQCNGLVSLSHKKCNTPYLFPSGLKARALMGPKCPFTPPISSWRIYQTKEKNIIQPNWLLTQRSQEECNRRLNLVIKFSFKLSCTMISCCHSWSILTTTKHHLKAKKDVLSQDI